MCIRKHGFYLCQKCPSGFKECSSAPTKLEEEHEKVKESLQSSKDKKVN